MPKHLILNAVGLSQKLLNSGHMPQLAAYAKELGGARAWTPQIPAVTAGVWNFPKHHQFGFPRLPTGYAPTPRRAPLQCSPNSFSWTTPAPLNFSLDTEAWYPLHTYRILFSNSGVAPGFDIGDAYIAGSHIGLNLDQVLLRSYYSPNTNVYQNNYAALDSAGLATSQLSLPANIPATFIGSPICAQALVFNMAGELLYTSNSIEIMINL